VGLIARTIEAAGIPTICIIGLREIAEKVRPPRSLYLKWPFGHPFGEPGNRLQQRSVLHATFRALSDIQPPATIYEPGWQWRRQRYTDPFGA
jgi:hypothetical protein